MRVRVNLRTLQGYLTHKNVASGKGGESLGEERAGLLLPVVPRISQSPHIGNILATVKFMWYLLVAGKAWEGYESRRCSRDTYPESHITK